MRSNLFSALLLGSLVASSALVAGCSSAEPGQEETDDALNGTSTGLLNLPFYFTAPKDSLTEITKDMRAKYSFSTAWAPSNESPEIGLRILAAKDSPDSRPLMGKDLGKSGVMQTGDVVLTFRPENAGTLPYVHLMMGITHAGLARVKDGVAHTVDQPLDTDTNGGIFQSRHYLEAKAVHIVRPRIFEQDPSRREKLDVWQGLAEGLIGSSKKPAFNSSYVQPMTANPAAPQLFNNPALVSTVFGKDLIKGDASELAFFCSEMAYHLLTLSNCTKDEIQNTPQGQAAECAKTGAPFAMALPVETHIGGLAEGPLLTALASGGLPEAALRSIFVTGDAASVSSGHKAANAMLVQMGLLPLAGGGPIEANYLTRGKDPNAAVVDAEKMAKVPPNYSPTTFLIQSLKPRATRAVDYVATVAFLSDAKLVQAKELAQKPIPHTENSR